MSGTLSLPFALLAGVILLPLIPAFIIFKLLPASADVSGPFQGFEIKLGGAFGAYFALVVLVLFTKNGIWDPPAPVTWTIHGILYDDTGAPITPLGPQDVQLSPPNPADEQDGNYQVIVPAQDGVAYPTLIFWHKCYGEVAVDLDPAVPPPSGATKHVGPGYNAEIDLHLLQKEHDYDPNQPALNAGPATTPAPASQSATPGDC